MNSKRIIILISIIFLLGGAAFADYPSATVQVSPGIAVPVFGAESDNLGFGIGADIGGNLHLSFFQPLSIGLHVAYGLSGIPDSQFTLSFISAALQTGLDFEVVSKLFLFVHGKVGYFYTFFNDEPSTSGSSLFFEPSLGAYYRLVPGFSLGLEAGMRNYTNLVTSVTVSLGANLHFGTSGEREPREKRERPQKVKPEPVKEQTDLKGEGVDLVSVEFVPVFPVFFKYYDSNPIGKAVIRNFEKIAIENIKVSFYEKQYMTNPKEATTIDRLEPGEEREIDVFGLFTNEVLSITEGTKVSAQILIDYVQDGEAVSKEYIETLRLYNRNAMTWDDDRKAGAFVTAKDPAVMKFSKNIAGWVKGKGSRAVNANLKTAMALHEALDLYGISYVIDPTTPYIEFSVDTLAIDYLQFPKQTLEFLAGDCDDLSILYSSLLEAAGIETAFVTTPGHIFVALNLNMTPDDARDNFLYPDDLIFRDKESWLPVEITERGKGFVKAWQTGAKEWRENDPKNQAGFFAMHPAWEVYEPVGFPGSIDVDLPERNDIVATYEQELESFIEREMSPKLSLIQAKLAESQGNLKYINRLGVLYARYGLDDKAMTEFQRVLKQKEYISTLLNVGNLYYIQENMDEAAEYYERALELSPNSSKALLSVARVNHEVENYSTARKAYAKLKDVDPILASRFSYLDLRGDEASRAADAAQIKSVILWEEEEE